MDCTEGPSKTHDFMLGSSLCGHLFSRKLVHYNMLLNFSQIHVVSQGTIEGRRDIAGGRLGSDRRAAGNSSSGQCFTSLAFSADGSWLLAGAGPPISLLN